MQTAYLNQAGTSWPLPEPVREAMSAAMSRSPAEWGEPFEQAHQAIAEFFHIDDPSRLLLTPGGTSALAVAVADLPWQPGDRVLTSSYEHHALRRPLVKLQDLGVRVEAVPRSDEGPLDLDQLEQALQQGGVRLVAMTAASNVTGDLLPVEQIVTLAHRYDALVLIDAAQTAGWWDIDVPASGTDLFAFTGHKGLQGPWGIGGLYVSPHVTMNSPAAACELPKDGGPPVCSTMPGYCDTGSVDRIALAALAAAVTWLGQHEQQDRLDRARRQAERLRQVAVQAGATLFGQADPSRRLPTVALTCSRHTPAELARRLADRGVVASGGLQCAPQTHQTLGTAPDGVLRLSVGVSTTDEEVALAAETLADVLA
ncbi:Cysteine desulfurase [Maioricimonas rarisocia]|uniref:Cysteine desulfurase n=1 Tax=Maioricimonas rarisocia TaxID=2528026 RepID=A0A517ZEN1_9PLAN|nr:aminotransferase class V-fold PLP-dependent enzyme [Maioricimonas rarisocia]QDU40940.1 Cysteine desulfurase [Maioricimonas rarisocia]